MSDKLEQLNELIKEYGVAVAGYAEYERTKNAQACILQAAKITAQHMSIIVFVKDNFEEKIK